jgi:hypothetical protein
LILYNMPGWINGTLVNNSLVHYGEQQIGRHFAFFSLLI